MINVYRYVLSSIITIFGVDKSMYLLYMFCTGINNFSFIVFSMCIAFHVCVCYIVKGINAVFVVLVNNNKFIYNRVHNNDVRDLFIYSFVQQQLS